MQVLPTAMLRRFDILCVSLACALAYKYNEEATDASEAQTADLGKSFDAQKEETSAKAFERQKQVLDDDMKEATVAMKPIKTVTAAASEAQKVVFAKRFSDPACGTRVQAFTPYCGCKANHLSTCNLANRTTWVI